MGPEASQGNNLEVQQEQGQQQNPEAKSPEDIIALFAEMSYDKDTDFIDIHNQAEGKIDILKQEKFFQKIDENNNELSQAEKEFQQAVETIQESQMKINFVYEVMLGLQEKLDTRDRFVKKKVADMSLDELLAAKDYVLRNREEIVKEKGIAFRDAAINRLDSEQEIQHFLGEIDTRLSGEFQGQYGDGVDSVSQGNISPADKQQSSRAEHNTNQVDTDFQKLQSIAYTPGDTVKQNYQKSLLTELFGPSFFDKGFGTYKGKTYVYNLTFGEGYTIQTVDEFQTNIQTSFNNFLDGTPRSSYEKEMFLRRHGMEILNYISATINDSTLPVESIFGEKEIKFLSVYLRSSIEKKTEDGSISESLVGVNNSTNELEVLRNIAKNTIQEHIKKTSVVEAVDIATDDISKSVDNMLTFLQKYYIDGVELSEVERTAFEKNMKDLELQLSSCTDASYMKKLLQIKEDTGTEIGNNLSKFLSDIQLLHPFIRTQLAMDTVRLTPNKLVYLDFYSMNYEQARTILQFNILGDISERNMVIDGSTEKEPPSEFLGAFIQRLASENPDVAEGVLKDFYEQAKNNPTLREYIESDAQLRCILDPQQTEMTLFEQIKSGARKEYEEGKKNIMDLFINNSKTIENQLGEMKEGDKRELVHLLGKAIQLGEMREIHYTLYSLLLEDNMVGDELAYSLYQNKKTSLLLAKYALERNSPEPFVQTQYLKDRQVLDVYFNFKKAGQEGIETNAWLYGEIFKREPQALLYFFKQLGEEKGILKKFTEGFRQDIYLAIASFRSGENIPVEYQAIYTQLKNTTEGYIKAQKKITNSVNEVNEKIFNGKGEDTPNSEGAGKQLELTFTDLLTNIVDTEKKSGNNEKALTLLKEHCSMYEGRILFNETGFAKALSAEQLTPEEIEGVVSSMVDMLNKLSQKLVHIAKENLKSIEGAGADKRITTVDKDGHVRISDKLTRQAYSKFMQQLEEKDPEKKYTLQDSLDLFVQEMELNKEQAKAVKDILTAENDAQAIQYKQEHLVEYVSYLQSGATGSFSSYVEKVESGEIELPVVGENIGEANSVLSSYSKTTLPGYSISVETMSLTTPTKTLTISEEEAKLLENNPEAQKNMVHFYNNLEKTGLESLWDNRVDILKGIASVKGTEFSYANGDYLSEKEMMTFFNAILVSVGEQPIAETTGMDDMVSIVTQKANRQAISGEVERNSYGRSMLEQRFFDAYISGAEGTVAGLFAEQKFREAIS